MLQKPMDILEQFPVRKTGLQKQAFRDAVQDYAQKAGYRVSVEQGSFGVRNLVLGSPDQAQYLVTAHYDTCARLPFPNFLTPCNLFGFLLTQTALFLGIVAISTLVGVLVGLCFGAQWVSLSSSITLLAIVTWMLCGPANPANVNDNTSGIITLLEIARTLPESQRGKVCFVLFDLEEAGLLGSRAYRKAHQSAAKNQLVLNLDCVGDGDHIRLFPTKKLLKDRKRCTSLYKACGYFGKKEILVHEKGFSVYPSDQNNFPYGVGICALRKGKLGLFVSRIHTPKDTVLDENNVNLLRAALTTFLCRDAAT